MPSIKNSGKIGSGVFQWDIKTKTVVKGPGSGRQGYNLYGTNEQLFEMGFERVDFVTGPGEFAVRGGIIDVFSFAYQHPYRIEFFDETVERLSSFDVSSQRSISAFEEIEILPNTSDHDFTDKRKSLLSFFSSESSVVFADLDKTTDRLEQLYEKAEKVYQEMDTTTQYAPEILFVKPQEWIADCQNRSVFVLEKTTFSTAEIRS